MGIKDINEIIHQGVVPRRKERFSERIKKIDPKYTSMCEVVPPLNRGEFQRSWQEDSTDVFSLPATMERAYDYITDLIPIVADETGIHAVG